MKITFTEYKNKIDILQILVNHRATLRINGDEFDIEGVGILRPGDYLVHDEEELHCIAARDELQCFKEFLGEYCTVL